MFYKTEKIQCVIAKHKLMLGAKRAIKLKFENFDLVIDVIRDLLAQRHNYNQIYM